MEDTSGEYPALAAQGMKGTGSENYGGPMVTAGGLFLSERLSMTECFAPSTAALDSSYGRPSCPLPVWRHRPLTPSMESNMSLLPQAAGETPSHPPEVRILPSHCHEVLAHRGNQKQIRLATRDTGFILLRLLRSAPRFPPASCPLSREGKRPR